MSIQIGDLVKHAQTRFDSVYIITKSFENEIFRVYDIKDGQEYSFCSYNLTKLNKDTEAK